MQSLVDMRAWYVLYSKPHKEEAAQFHLRLKGVEVFFPKLFYPRAPKVRKQLVPLFPNYLFVRVRLPEEYDLVTWTSGVKRFVSFNDTPLPLEQNVITYLMDEADSHGVIMARANYHVGQEVRITGGPFDGLAGIIQEPPNARGRVKVLMELLRRPMRVDVPLEFLEAGGATHPVAVHAALGSQPRD